MRRFKQGMLVTNVAGRAEALRVQDVITSPLRTSVYEGKTPPKKKQLQQQNATSRKTRTGWRRCHATRVTGGAVKRQSHQRHPLEFNKHPWGSSFGFFGGRGFVVSLLYHYSPSEPIIPPAMSDTRSPNRLGQQRTSNSSGACTIRVSIESARWSSRTRSPVWFFATS